MAEGLDSVERWIGKAEIAYRTNTAILDSLNTLIKLNHFGDGRLELRRAEMEEAKERKDKEKTAQLERILEMEADLKMMRMGQMDSQHQERETLRIEHEFKRWKEEKEEKEEKEKEEIKRMEF